jgi:hypothetical protein
MLVYKDHEPWFQIRTLYHFLGGSYLVCPLSLSKLQNEAI